MPTEPERWEHGELAQERFRQLIMDLGEELHRAHGWKRRVAERLEMNASHLSRVLNRRMTVGGELLHRTARILDFDPRYYQSTQGTYRDWHRASVILDALENLNDLKATATARRIRESYTRTATVAETDAELLSRKILSLAPVSAAVRYRDAKSPRERAEAAYVMASTLSHLFLLLDGMTLEEFLASEA